MKALVIVDVQYDFMPGGALAVKEGDLITAQIIKIRDCFDLVVFTQDWHPADHCSFKENGGIWPVHCVQNTKGAQIDNRLIRPDDIIVRKGIHKDIDSYSGFWDNERKHKTELDAILKNKQVDTIYVCGLATDYCVKFTAIDGVEAGFKVYLVEDACCGVDVHEGDSRQAILDMSNRGIIIVNHNAILG
jgi:nicotinamidase/pyrazinamidase